MFHIFHYIEIKTPSQWKKKTAYCCILFRKNGENSAHMPKKPTTGKLLWYNQINNLMEEGRENA